MDFCLIYITAKDKAEAKKIGRELVKSRLVACVNIIDGISSIYFWQGDLAESKETMLIAKTRKSLVKKVIAKVKSLHSYECPCVLAVPIADGNFEFLEWVKMETKLQE